jgi:RNA polymerase sigma factor for flagellar operon FliA
LKSKALPYTGTYPTFPPSVPPDTAPKNQDEMILRYAPFIKYIAHRLAMRLPPHIMVEDLMSAGVIGLMDALAKFDPQKKVEFKTYAEFRIRGAMLDELRSLDWVPRSVRQKASVIEKSILHLEKTKGRSVGEEEIANHLEMSLEEYYQMVREINGIPLLDQDLLQEKIGKLSDEEIINLLLDEEANDPFHQLSLKELKRVLAEAIQALSSKEKQVISLYYQEELTLKEIGEVLQLTESRICQIHTKAILELRGKLRRFIEEESS